MEIENIVANQIYLKAREGEDKFLFIANYLPQGLLIYRDLSFCLATGKFSFTDRFLQS